MRRMIIGIIGAGLIAATTGLSVADQRSGGGGRQGGTTMGPGSGQRGPQAPVPKHPDVRQGSQNAKTIQQRARDLERHAAAGDSVRIMLRDRDRIHEQFREMEQAHQRWRDGLGEQDRLSLRDRLRDLDQQHERLRTALGDLNAALGEPSPDRKRIQELARQISRETETWRNTWHTAAQGTPATPPR